MSRPQLVSYLRLRIANHVLMRVLRAALPDDLPLALPELPEDVHIDVRSTSAGVLQRIQPVLEQQRTRLRVGDSYMAAMAAAAEANPVLVPPLSIVRALRAPLVSPPLPPTHHPPLTHPPHPTPHHTTPHHTTQRHPTPPRPTPPHPTPPHPSPHSC